MILLIYMGFQNKDEYLLGIKYIFLIKKLLKSLRLLDFTTIFKKISNYLGFINYMYIEYTTNFKNFG